MRCRAARLAAALAILAWGAAPSHGAAKLPEWARAAADAPAPERWRGADAVVLADETTIVARAGARTGVHRRVVRILTKEGIHAGALHAWGGPFESVQNAELWVRKDSGEVAHVDRGRSFVALSSSKDSFDDEQLVELRSPEVAPGAVVVTEHVFAVSAEWPQDRVAIQDRWPVVRASVSVRVEGEDGWTVAAKTGGGPNPGPAGPMTSGTWVFADVAPLAIGDGRAPPLLFLALDHIPPGGLAPFRDWSSVAGWEMKLFDLPGGPTPAMDRLVDGVRQSRNDPIAEAGLRARQVRYFAIELGWGGFRPRPPERTLERGLGDCKDKTQVMIALLRRLGVACMPVLVGTPSGRHVDEAAPGDQFNHVIAGIPWTGRERGRGMTIVDAPGIGPLRLFDPTLNPDDGRDTASLEGARGLALDRRTTGLLTVGVGPSEESAYAIRQRLVFESTGAVVIEVTLRAEGGLRTMLEGADDEPLKVQEVRRLLNRTYPMLWPELTGVEVSDARKDGSALTASARLFRPAAAGALAEFQLGPLVRLEDFPAPDPERAAAAALPFLGVVREEVELAGRRVTRPPSPVRVENALGRVVVETRETPDRFVIVREIALFAREAAPSEQAELRALREALRRANAEVLRWD